MIRTKPLPAHFFLGLTLVAIFWIASWTHLGVFGEYAFFPLWLGYTLTVDGIVGFRKGSSLLTHNPNEFVALFVLSTPIWWIFEFHNYFLLNWHYLGSHDATFLEVIVVGTIDFSTVIPAIFETRELIGTFDLLRRPGSPAKVELAIAPRRLWMVMYGAVIMFAGVLYLPRYFFPFTWIWLFCFIDALNCMRGRSSLIQQAASGEWRNIAALALAGLCCGFFWEMWNYYALPKWYYTVPFVNYLKIFEMPLLGYGGYIPFAWELYAIYHFIWGVLRRPAIA
jgi:hypothetical protein